MALQKIIDGSVLAIAYDIKDDYKHYQLFNSCQIKECKCQDKKSLKYYITGLPVKFHLTIENSCRLCWKEFRNASNCNKIKHDFIILSLQTALNNLSKSEEKEKVEVVNAIKLLAKNVDDLKFNIYDA